MRQRYITKLLIFIQLMILLLTIVSARPTSSKIPQPNTFNPITPSMTDSNLEIDELLDLRISIPIILGGISIDNGEVLVSGIFTDNISGFFIQGFYSKITTEGVISWTRSIGSRDSRALMRSNPIILSTGNIIYALQTIDSNLPVFSNSFQDIRPGGPILYIFEYSPQADEIVWSTYLGGFIDDCCVVTSIDADDNLYTSSISWSFNFPIINSTDTQYSGDSDAAFVKFNQNRDVVWSRLFGGEGTDYVLTSTYGPDNSLNFGGRTNSANITTAGAYQTSNNGGWDGFVGKLNSTTGERLWSTFLGGSGFDVIDIVVSDSSGNVYAAGSTNSPDFPLLNPMDSTYEGNAEMFLTKFSPNGTLLWSTYLGGENWDAMHELSFDTDDNLLISGITSSSDFPSTDSSNVTGGRDFFFTKLDPDTLTILSSTIFGTSQDDYFLGFDRDDDNYYFYGGIPESLVYNNQHLNSTYPFDFGETDREFVMSIDKDTMDLNWYTETVAIPEYDLDYDQDGLTNEREYNLCMNDINSICLDPMDTDTDDDGISDGYEVDYSLNPTQPDTSGDADGDGLTNLEEFEAGTDPFSADTDLDGMPDDWEVRMGTNPILDDAQGDLDGDGMTNIYEYNNVFDASDPADAAHDGDNDGLTNLEEFEAGTDPSISDTDKDSMPDGWELTHNLDPLDPADADIDSDGDFLPNRLEYKLNLNPNSPIELVIAVIFILMVVSGVFGYKRFRRKREEKAISEGWNSYDQKRNAIKAGFDGYDAYAEAEQRGFVNTRANDLFDSYGFSSLKEFKSMMDREIAEITLTLNIENHKDLITMIDNSQSPKELSRVNESMQTYFDQLQEMEVSLENWDTLLKQSLDLMETENGELFTSFTQENIGLRRTQISDLLSNLEGIRNELLTAFEQRKEWLKPWQSFLSLVQITEDGKPISLKRISDVTQTEMEQAEDLVIAVLKEYPNIGVYNQVTREYKKGVDVSEYLKKALEFSKDL